MSETPSYDYDIIIIGGGSGGVACAREAASLGAKVAVFDFVKPSPQGTKWGLGGTCVNVGCIPKKLMHRAAAILGDIHDAPFFGWTGVEPEKAKINWEDLIMAVQNHVHKLNFGYRNELRQAGVNYINAYATFQDEHTIAYTLKKQDKTATAKYIVIACGGRPTYPDLPGAEECCITSDDFFSLDEAPGKTLCIGASFIALECAGVLSELGYDTTVMVRSILLRGFDQEVATKVGEFMERHGTKFQREQTPTSFTKQENGKILVKSKGKLGEKEEEFDTVIMAVGRHAVTAGLNLSNAHVETAPNGKIPVDAAATTNVPHIFCIGDAQLGAPELTPTAIQSGRFLARRLFGGSKAVVQYETVPTCVFTPIEYGAIGLSEDRAKEVYGEENVMCYVNSFNPLEWQPTEVREHDAPGFVKYVCETKTLRGTSGETAEPPKPAKKEEEEQKEGDAPTSSSSSSSSSSSATLPLPAPKAEQRIVGLHYLGPNAAEVINGYAPALGMNATKLDFERVVGIHPCTSEEISNTRWLKGSPEALAGPSGC